MKRFSAVLILGLVISVFSFAQTQTGNASYNPSKPGFAISHPSLSFNTRVRVTNLRNNRSVEASVNGRIPISSERIADIARDAGDALGMDKTAALVEIEVLPPRETASTPAPAQSAAPAAPASPQPAAAPSAPPPQGQSPAPVTTEPGQVQTITDVRYIPVPAAAPLQPCSGGPLFVVILLLLVLVIILLLAILILLLRRLFHWPWHYPVWYRRHLLYAKKRRQ
jgi:hypothetical protein